MVCVRAKGSVCVEPFLTYKVREGEVGKDASLSAVWDVGNELRVQCVCKGQ